MSPLLPRHLPLSSPSPPGPCWSHANSASRTVPSCQEISSPSPTELCPLVLFLSPASSPSPPGCEEKWSSIPVCSSECLGGRQGVLVLKTALLTQENLAAKVLCSQRVSNLRRGQMHVDSGFSVSPSVACHLSVAHGCGATVNRTPSTDLNSMSGKQKLSVERLCKPGGEEERNYSVNLISRDLCK